MIYPCKHSFLLSEQTVSYVARQLVVPDLASAKQHDSYHEWTL